MKNACLQQQNHPNNMCSLIFAYKDCVSPSVVVFWPLNTPYLKQLPDVHSSPHKVFIPVRFDHNCCQPWGKLDFLNPYVIIEEQLVLEQVSFYNEYNQVLTTSFPTTANSSTALPLSRFFLQKLLNVDFFKKKCVKTMPLIMEHMLH